MILATTKSKLSTSKAIRDMIPIIDPEEDYLTIAAAEEQMAVTEAARKKELDETQSKMRGMYPTLCFILALC